MSYNHGLPVHSFESEQARRDEAANRVRCDCGARILNAPLEENGQRMSRMDYHLYHECPLLFERSAAEKREAIKRWQVVLAAMPKPKKEPIVRKPKVAPLPEKKAEPQNLSWFRMPVKYPLPIVYPITTYAGQQISRVDDDGRPVKGPDGLPSDILF
jgi:hypothetical protein